MFKRLLVLEWRAFFRSASIGRDLAVRILMICLAIYFGVSFLALGIGLYPLLSEVIPDTKPLQLVNNYLIFWFLFELVLRLTLQSIPSLHVQPLLVQNVKRKIIVRYTLLKSFFSIYNLLAPLLFIPFGIWCISMGDATIGAMAGWWTAILSFSLAIHFIILMISKKFSDNIKVLIHILICVAILGALAYWQVVSLPEWFAQLMTYLLIHPWIAPLFLMIPIAIAIIAFRNLLNNLYLDNLMGSKSTKVALTDLTWTDRFGNIAPFLRLDLRLIWRNKRPKGTVWMSLLFSTYGLIFFNLYDQMDYFIVFLGLMMTGIFAINFGQFIPAWDSSYYAMMMTQNFSMKRYLVSKTGLMYLSIVVLCILTIPYIYFGIDLYLMILACGIYNAGINVPIILYAGSYNNKRIELDKSVFLNYQGTGMAQWIIGIPLFCIPMVIGILVQWIFGMLVAAATLALIGIIGLLFRSTMMEYIVRNYKLKKFSMIDGFKQVG